MKTYSIKSILTPKTTITCAENTDFRFTSPSFLVENGLKI
jgi:hypothetical protein